MNKQIKNKIAEELKRAVVAVVLLVMVFPYGALVALAQSVPVEETGENLTENRRTAEERIPQTNSSVVSNTSSMVQMLGEIMAPVYQLSTPGSYLMKDISRFIMKNTEDELGIDKDIFRRMSRKADAPTVDIVFAPTNPKVGQKVTAFAIPRGFKNSKEKLYYNWYLVHKGEEDVEAGREEAMIIAARGGYDKDLFFGTNDPTGEGDGDRDAYDASYGGDDGRGKKSGSVEEEDCKGCKCLRHMTMMNGVVDRGCFDDQGELLYASTESYDEAIENRGSIGEGNDKTARPGRLAINSDFITRCYRHNFGGQNGDADEYSGRDLIIHCEHAFGKDVGGGDLEFGTADESRWKTNPENADTDGDGVVDEADLVGLSQDQFTWIYREGDRVSVAVEGMSNIPINEGTTDRLRYGNKNWDKGESGHAKKEEEKDLSPTASPEDWYKDVRQKCLDDKKDCLVGWGNSMDYKTVVERIPAESKCVQEYSDCMKDLWEYEQKETNDEDAFGEMTGYYKIMWAAPGVCTNLKKNEARGDWCEYDEDIGFQYLKLYDPVERGKQLMEVSVNVTPKNPQFSVANDDIGANFSGDHNDSTDMIIATADVVSQDNIDSDYLYYKWSLWSCDPKDFDKCDELLPRDVDFVSRAEGIGLREIGFYPKDDIFDTKRALLKIGVVVKKHKNSAMSSPGVNGEYNEQIFSNEKNEITRVRNYTQKYSYTASELVEVIKHDMKIKLFQATPTDGGYWEYDSNKEICTGEGDEPSVYRKICPVYQYQVLAAEVDNAGEAVTWKLNGKTIQPTMNGSNNVDANDHVIFFPVTGVDGTLNRIGVVSEVEAEDGLWEDNNMMEERILSVRKPMAVIEDKEGSLDVDSIQRAFTGKENGIRKRSMKGRQLWWVLGLDEFLDEAVLSVNVPVKIVPRYLQGEVDSRNLIMRAYSNGADAGEITSGRDNMVFEGVTFKSFEGEGNDLKVRTMRVFSDEYKNALKQSFGISPLDELVDDLDVKVKTIVPEEYTALSGRQVGLNSKDKRKMFFASTIRSAPEYFIFIMRLAVSFVLIGMITFGMMYGVGIRKIKNS